MKRQMRIEIVGRDRFWHDAFFVEWAHQFPERELKPEPHGLYCIDADWLADLERVAAQCFSRVVVAPENPGRRHWFRRLLPRRE
jgi:hypothetical protein